MRASAVDAGAVVEATGPEVSVVALVGADVAPAETGTVTLDGAVLVTNPIVATVAVTVVVGSAAAGPTAAPVSTASEQRTPSQVPGSALVAVNAPRVFKRTSPLSASTPSTMTETSEPSGITASSRAASVTSAGSASSVVSSTTTAMSVPPTSPAGRRRLTTDGTESGTVVVLASSWTAVGSVAAATGSEVAGSSLTTVAATVDDSRRPPRSLRAIPAEVDGRPVPVMTTARVAMASDPTAPAATASANCDRLARRAASGARACAPSSDG